ncbi:GL21534 [Drosophila persimilis]|uniref:GL21534 n=1 Tax=Drosophila persimilis TaxID=7234 RepID=B4GFY5_DROPE|nr:calmodulin [Drosophila persimilis]EDW34520.1 GL21534 [Drosophila persimilis]
MDEFDFSTPPPEERVSHSHTLTDEQSKDCTTVFDMFDPENTGVLPLKQIKYLMRALAVFPTDLELSDIYAEIDTDGSGDMLRDDFLYIMSKMYKDMTPEDEIIAAFKVFDKEGTGVIAETEFRHIMTNLGDKMTEDEIEEIIRDADSDTEGNIDYVRFVTMMSER